jgi:hypothetical protein
MSGSDYHTLPLCNSGVRVQLHAATLADFKLCLPFFLALLTGFDASKSNGLNETVEVMLFYQALQVLRVKHSR